MATKIYKLVTKLVLVASWLWNKKVNFKPCKGFLFTYGFQLPFSFTLKKIQLFHMPKFWNLPKIMLRHLLHVETCYLFTMKSLWRQFCRTYPTIENDIHKVNYLLYSNKRTRRRRIVFQNVIDCNTQQSTEVKSFGPKGRKVLVTKTFVLATTSKNLAASWPQGFFFLSRALV